MARKDREVVNRGLNDIFAAGEDDLLGRVIRSDRNRSGRNACRPPPGTTRPASSDPGVDVGGGGDEHVITRYDNMTDKQYDNMTSHGAAGRADKASGPIAFPSRVPEGGSKAPAPPKPHLLMGRIAEGAGMARSGTTTVTLRLPGELNGWLDEYVHRSWPERVRKQELVIEALRMLFARHGRPGEPVLETELLPGRGR